MVDVECEDRHARGKRHDEDGHAIVDAYMGERKVGQCTYHAGACVPLLTARTYLALPKR